MTTRAPDYRDDHGRQPEVDQYSRAHDNYERQYDGLRASHRQDPRSNRWIEGRQPDHDGPEDYAHSYRARGRGPDEEYARQRYQDRDDVNYRSPRRNYYSRSPSRSRSHSRSYSRSPPRRDRRRSPSYNMPPNRDIMMEGLPYAMDDKDVKSELEQYYHIEGIRDVKIIRDHRTGHSRGFGFLQFKNVSAARLFMERHEPEIEMQGREKRVSKVTIAYSRPRDDRDQAADEDWICSNCTTSNFARRIECYKCQASKALYNAGPPSDNRIRNTGDSDVSPDATPSQFLLFRGLEASVTEELLAKGASKLYKIADQSSAQTDNKPKMNSTTASSNFGALDGSIKRVFIVRDRDSQETWKYGFVEYHNVEDAQAACAKFHAMDKFTIASKPVMISYIHAGVFIPASIGEDERLSFAASNNPSLRLQYWDQDAFLTEYLVTADPPTTNAAIAQDDSKAVDLSSAAGIVKSNKAIKRKAESGATPSSKKTVPSHLQFWKNRHDELHGGQTHKGNDADSTKKQPEPSSQGHNASNSGEALPTQSYADPVKNCCYLCSRQFKSTAEVNKHERLSQLHRDNLGNDAIKQKALQKLAKAGIKMDAGASASSADGQSQPEYRDRAKERRSIYGQSKRPKKNASHDAAASTNKAASEDDEAGSKAPSKGASLLGKMGWTSGQGLGAKGTGSVAPIAQDVYAEGVGLGAAGGKLGDAVEEAERRTKGDYGSFLAKTRDTARDRWQALNTKE